MSSTPPPEVLAFQARMAQLQQEREQAFAAMGAATGTVTSEGGAVTVTSTAEGVVTDVQLRSDVPPPGPELAALLIQTTRQAHQRALQTAAHDVAAVVGADNPAVAVLQRQSGEVPVADTPAVRPDFGGEL